MNGITVYVVFKSPSDHPGWFVVRRQQATPRGVIVEKELFAKELTLAAVRAKLPQGLYNIGRQPDDDHVIVEVWV